MYRVTGANLFEQWFLPELVLEEFKIVCGNDNFDLDRAKLLQINWSYNIFQLDNSFYISGAGYRKGHCNEIRKVILPNLFKDSSSQNILLVGNDYNLMFIDTKMFVMGFVDIESSELKEVNFKAERLITDTTKISTTESIIKVVTTNHSCLYLTSDGNLYIGMLPSIVDVSHCEGKVCDIQCGYEHFILLTELGRIYTWGNGRRLQLGHGNLENLDRPTELEALAGIKIVKIRAGGWHTLALSEHGDLYVWGWNDIGQLGVNEKEKPCSENSNPSGLPVLVDFFDEKGRNIDVKDMAAGSRHTAVVLEDNSVWTTGCNKYGQCGFSPKILPKVEYFQKAFQSEVDCELFCGPWSTVLRKS